MSSLECFVDSHGVDVGVLYADVVRCLKSRGIQLVQIYLLCARLIMNVDAAAHSYRKDMGSSCDSIAASLGSSCPVNRYKVP